ncbi:MAG: UvrD/REP helicase [Parcubacteria group bacterium GW2011_GWE2_38_18]|nr:MAG: UvrD/REP helicase [Parcubacteria group bacterium GW2011_GWE2_38_18]
MRQILDLHIHSKYSRACSKELTLSNIDAACRIKGIDIIGTGDFTYPAWFRSIISELIEIGDSGLYRHKKGKDEQIKFLLSAEVALIYKDNGKARRIHLVVHAPNIAAAEALNNFLDKKYNIRSDGRPILGMSSPDFVKLCLSIHPHFLIYPAHIWTPWFSVFGSKSGFDTFEECFKDQTENVFAYETGLSSDPQMNWRVSALDKLTLLSNSDAHSLSNLGREANIFDLDKISYEEIYKAIKNNDKKSFKGTIEFYPEEGMYHNDGHRTCKINLTPAETKAKQGICPVCHTPLVIGVANRVAELADRAEGYKPQEAPEYIKLIGLDKIIAEASGVKSRSAKKVKIVYENMISNLGNELEILMNQPIERIKEMSGPVIAEAIKRVREGRLIIKPGFDGQYGKIKIFNQDELKKNGEWRLLL